MYVLGLNSVYHESASCLIKDGRLIAAAEEERFNRFKHGKLARGDNPDELPLRSLQYCLAEAGVSIEEVDYVGYSASPAAFRQAMGESPNAMEMVFLAALERIPQKLAALGFQGKLIWVDHHMAHAASAYYVSPFNDAAVLVVDGKGEANTALLCHGQHHHLRSLQTVPFPASLGFLWEIISVFLGFDVYDAAKVMGLAAYGDPGRFAAALQQIAQPLPDGTFTIDNSVTRFGSLTYYPPAADFSALARVLGIAPRPAGADMMVEHEDVAAALQQLTNQLLLRMARRLHTETRSDNLCLAGGVALNCVSNSALLQEGPFAHLFVQPAAQDAGTALGAAYHVWHQVLHRTERDVMRHAYLGPSFSNAEIEERLRAHGVPYRRSDHLEQDVAELLSENNIVGFFQGRMELGPRALGNRSLLADPRDPGIRETLNRKVKHREYFRPLAPSVMEEEADRWFAIGKETTASEFMLMTWPVQAEVRARIPAVVHFDGSCRIQVVRQATNPRFHKVLAEFHRRTGVPVLLNTSFNDSEPIVCTPDDAIHTFIKTKIDYLAIGDFIVGELKGAYSAPPR